MIDGEGRDTKTNLCDTCRNVADFPVCIPVDVIFGDGPGFDNIIECSLHRELSPSGTGFEEVTDEEPTPEQDDDHPF